MWVRSRAFEAALRTVPGPRIMRQNATVQARVNPIRTPPFAAQKHHDQIRIDHWSHRAGRRVPVALSCRQGLQGVRYRGAAWHRHFVAPARPGRCRLGDRDPRRSHRHGIAVPGGRDGAAGRGLQPGRAKLRRHLVAAACDDRAGERGRRRKHARSAPPHGLQGQILPSVDQRDVRSGPGRVTVRDDAVLPAQPRTAWPSFSATGSR